MRRLAEEAEAFAVDFPLDAIAYEIPIPSPEKIICVGVNYPDRNEEYKDGQAAPSNPSLFIRFPRSFVGHDAPLVRPPESPQLDYEGEIVIVIGKGGRRIAESAMRSAISRRCRCATKARSATGCGTPNSTSRKARISTAPARSARGWCRSPTRRRSPTSRSTTRVNGELRQQDRTSRMIFSFRKIIAYISTFTTLVPGDIIVTGTPTGAGARFDPPIWLKPGDVSRSRPTASACCATASSTRQHA